MQFDRLVTLLESNGARFRVLEHPAQGRSDLVAQLRGTAPGQGAKAMLCTSKDGDVHALVVLPGDRKLDFRKVADALGIRKATLASAEDARVLTGCVIGAIPPFVPDGGTLRLVVDPALVQGFDEIAFNAGRLDRSIVLDSRDYVRIARPALHAVCA